MFVSDNSVYYTREMLGNFHVASTTQIFCTLNTYTCTASWIYSAIRYQALKQKEFSDILIDSFKTAKTRFDGIYIHELIVKSQENTN